MRNRLVKSIIGTKSAVGARSSRLAALVAGYVFAMPVTTAIAADPVQPIPVPPEPVVVESSSAHDWSGLYAGIHGGYLWGQTNMDWVEVGDPVTAFGPVDFSTLFGGVHLGANIQGGRAVIGIEGAFDYMPISGDDAGEGGTLNTFEANYMASLGLRAGIAADTVLFYLSGGIAYMAARVTDIDLDETADYALTGYTLGGGVEWAFDDNASLRLDYKYADFGQQFQNFAQDYDLGLDPGIHMVSVGLSYRF